MTASSLETRQLCEKLHSEIFPFNLLVFGEESGGVRGQSLQSVADRSGGGRAAGERSGRRGGGLLEPAGGRRGWMARAEASITYG